MLAIEVEFLMGRAVAARWEGRDRAEWPPHPQRLFSALVATHFDLDLGPKSEAALRWLETLPAPELRADPDPSYRTTHIHWVPINDETVKVEKGKVDFRHVLERRDRKERFFPAAVPNDSVVVYQWPSAPGVEEHREALSRLVEGLSYLGHSSSPVRACLREAPVEPTLVPDETGEFSLRIPGPGRFDRLSQVHALRLEDESLQPPLGRTQAYGLRSDIPHSVFSPEALVISFDGGPRLSLGSTLPLMQHLRSAVLARLGDSAPEILTGHAEDGNASADPHLAFVPLAFVRSRHADGSLKGAALVLPRAADSSARRRLRSAVLNPWELHLGPLGSITVQLVEERDPALQSLRFAAYSRPSCQWVSVTPVVLDRHPKKGKLTTEQIIADSCVRAGLPRPIEVRVGHVSVLAGAPPVREFHGESKQTANRLRCHALLQFERPVRGPVLLGAGRFLGLGVFLPIGRWAGP